MTISDVSGISINAVNYEVFSDSGTQFASSCAFTMSFDVVTTLPSTDPNIPTVEVHPGISENDTSSHGVVKITMNGWTDKFAVCVIYKDEDDKYYGCSDFTVTPDTNPTNNVNRSAFCDYVNLVPPSIPD